LVFYVVGKQFLRYAPLKDTDATTIQTPTLRARRRTAGEISNPTDGKARKEANEIECLSNALYY
jgi:hypothetical protein